MPKFSVDSPKKRVIRAFELLGFKIIHERPCGGCAIAQAVALSFKYINLDRGGQLCEQKRMEMHYAKLTE